MGEGNKVLENNTDILHKISKEECKDEWFIDKAILCYKAQNEKVFTFFRDNLQKDWLKKYNWCQRPDNTTMSLKRFDHIGNVHGHMSESLAEHYGLEQIDLNTFMHEFVAKLVEELNNLKEIEKSHQEENGKLRVELEQEKNKINTIKKLMSIEDITDEALFTLVQTIMAELERLEGIEEQLDKEKEKNKHLEEIENKLMPLAECSYWDYEKHTCTHTCRGCDELSSNNRRSTFGILIDEDRYCRLYEDGYAEEDTRYVNVSDLIKRHCKLEEK